MNIRSFSVIFQIFLWTTTFVLTLIWIFYPNPPFEPEPLTVALGLIATASSTFLNKYASKLKIEEFSTANALAVGYVNNFVEPVLTQLIKNNEESMFYIYLPNKLSDLYPKNIDRMVSDIKKSDLNNKTVSLKLDEGRGARDVMTIFNTDGKNVYFDFPNTLLTLEALVNYKIESKSNNFNNEEKDELGKEYIMIFKETVEKLLTDKNLYPEYVQFTDSINETSLKRNY